MQEFVSALKEAKDVNEARLLIKDHYAEFNEAEKILILRYCTASIKADSYYQKQPSDVIMAKAMLICLDYFDTLAIHHRKYVENAILKVMEVFRKEPKPIYMYIRNRAGKISSWNLNLSGLFCKIYSNYLLKDVLTGNFIRLFIKTHSWGCWSLSIQEDLARTWESHIMKRKLIRKALLRIYRNFDRSNHEYHIRNDISSYLRLKFGKDDMFDYFLIRFSKEAHGFRNIYSQMTKEKLAGSYKTMAGKELMMYLAKRANGNRGPFRVTPVVRLFKEHPVLYLFGESCSATKVFNCLLKRAFKANDDQYKNIAFDFGEDYFDDIKWKRVKNIQFISYELDMDRHVHFFEKLALEKGNLLNNSGFFNLIKTATPNLSRSSSDLRSETFKYYFLSIASCRDIKPHLALLIKFWRAEKLFKVDFRRLVKRHYHDLTNELWDVVFANHELTNLFLEAFHSEGMNQALAQMISDVRIKFGVNTRTATEYLRFSPIDTLESKIIKLGLMKLWSIPDTFILFCRPGNENLKEKVRNLLRNSKYLQKEVPTKDSIVSYISEHLGESVSKRIREISISSSITLWLPVVPLEDLTSDFSLIDTIVVKFFGEVLQNIDNSEVDNAWLDSFSTVLRLMYTFPVD